MITDHLPNRHGKAAGLNTYTGYANKQSSVGSLVKGRDARILKGDGFAGMD